MNLREEMYNLKKKMYADAVGVWYFDDEKTEVSLCRKCVGTMENKDMEDLVFHGDNPDGAIPPCEKCGKKYC